MQNPLTAILLCNSKAHPVYAYLLDWLQNSEHGKNAKLIQDKGEINTGADFLFLVSCSQIIDKETRSKFKHVLVLHASDLPEGRGWSPHIWDILAGKQTLTLSLLEAQDAVDTGDVWQKRHIPLQGTELYDEINHLLFCAELELIEWALDNAEQVTPQAQRASTTSLTAQNAGLNDGWAKQTPSYYPKRTAQDSLIDVDKSIAEQFDLLRVCDPHRFPAYFIYKGQRYTLTLHKSSQNSLQKSEDD